MRKATVEAASAYLERGWGVIRLKPRSKEPPNEAAHTASMITPENIGTLRKEENLGVYFSGKGELKDLDFDYPTAVALADELALEKTTATFGRPSAGLGHALYNSSGCGAKKFELPKASYPKPLPMHDGQPSRLVLEIRGADNTYTMFPPSVHPTGETLCWTNGRRDPTEIPADELRLFAGQLALAAATLYFYPDDAAARYDVRMALTGALSRSGMPADTVTEYVQAVAKLGGDRKWREDFAERTEQRLEDDKPTTGIPKLVAALALPEACIRTFHEWLNTSEAPVLEPNDPMRSAREIVTAKYTVRDGQRILHRHRGAFWRWDGACYRNVDTDTSRSDLWQFLEKALRRIPVKGGAWQIVPFKPTKESVSNVLDALNAACILDTRIEPPSWLSEDHPPANEFFPCSNGLLHLPTRKLYPPTPDYFGFYASEVVFDKKAPKPRLWLNFLNEVLGDRQAITLMQDWFGYCLPVDTSQQKILLGVGPRRSGKGTLMRVQNRLLGSSSVAGPTMSSLGEQFGLEPLITKPLAVISDARIGGRSDNSVIVERLLSISGEDAITVPRKYLLAWTGRLPTRLAIMTNELPSLKEGSGALVGRFLVEIFPNSFYGKEDKGLTDRLVTELSGILNWAIDGYQRLQERGHFVQPKNAQAKIEAMEMLGSPVKAFIRDSCIVRAGATIPVDTLYKAYMDWCAKQQTHPTNKEWFGRNLHSAEPGVVLSRKGTVRIYVGIALTANAEKASRYTY